MQVNPTSVSVRGDDNEPTVIDNPTVLMADFGCWVKTEETLEMYTWERVLRISFGDAESVKKVWEEAVLTVFEDLLDEFEDDEYSPEEVVVSPPPEPEPTPTEQNADDPEE